MKKFIFLLPICLLALFTIGGCYHAEAPYDRNPQADSYERNFRRYVLASCLNPGEFYSTYALARVNSKPNEDDYRYKVTFVNGPCKGKTIYTEDVILQTAPVSGGPLVKGEVVLRDFWNPRKLDPDTAKLDRWNKAVVYDTSRLDDGIVELEFPRDRNDFMATREFIYVHNVRYIQQPEYKDPRIWL